MHFGAMIIMIFFVFAGNVTLNSRGATIKTEMRKRGKKCKILQLSDLIYGFRVGGELEKWKKRYETEIFRFETLFALG